MVSAKTTADRMVSWHVYQAMFLLWTLWALTSTCTFLHWLVPRHVAAQQHCFRATRPAQQALACDLKKQVSLQRLTKGVTLSAELQAPHGYRLGY
jgi:hypothetical protein